MTSPSALPDLTSWAFDKRLWTRKREGKRFSKLVKKKSLEKKNKIRGLATSLKRFFRKTENLKLLKLQLRHIWTGSIVWKFVLIGWKVITSIIQIQSKKTAFRFYTGLHPARSVLEVYPSRHNAPFQRLEDVLKMS